MSNETESFPITEPVNIILLAHVLNHCLLHGEKILIKSNWLTVRVIAICIKVLFCMHFLISCTSLTVEVNHMIYS